MNTLIKICGITNLEDALASVDAGCEMLGFNFYAQSPRYIEPHAARAIVDELPERIVAVGVFVNESIETLREIVAISGVKMVQLHGDETPEYCDTLKNDGHTVMKVFHTGADFSLDRILEYDVPLVMLDAGGAQQRGGTGKVSNWSQAAQAKLVRPVCFLAGGLSAANVGAAISEVDPFGVDACSCLEVAPGKKDVAKVRDFIAAVREVSPL